MAKTMAKNKNVKALSVAAIRIDGGTQMRASIPTDTVEEYAEAWSSASKLDNPFPPVVVFYDGRDYWLGDGFLRLASAKRAGKSSVEADIRQGTQRDAILFACGANAKHGHRRTNEDKRRAVQTLLEDTEWGQRSDRWIAESCGVSNTFVSKIRHEFSREANPSSGRVGLDGKTRLVNSTVNVDSCRHENQANSLLDESAVEKEEPPPDCEDQSIDPSDSSELPSQPASEPCPSQDAKSDRQDKPEHEPEAASEPPSQVDGWGVPIQPHAAAAFDPASLAQYDEMLSCLKRADKLWSALAETPSGAYMLRPGLSINTRERYSSRSIKDAIAAVEDVRPTYTVCPNAYHALAHPESVPYGGGKHDESCVLCHGLNWSRALGKEEIDQAVVAKIKEAFGVQS